MECLICCKVYLHRPVAAELDNLDTSLTLSKLFDISPSSWLPEIDTNGPLSICPGCTEKLRQAHRELEEVDKLQSSLRGIKSEVFTDLIKSQETSQKNGYELKERAKIIKEISFSRAKQIEDNSYSIISETVTVTRSQPDEMILAAKSNENIKDSDDQQQQPKVSQFEGSSSKEGTQPDNSQQQRQQQNSESGIAAGIRRIPIRVEVEGRQVPFMYNHSNDDRDDSSPIPPASKKPPPPLNPMERIDLVSNDVKEIEKDVLAFTGNSREDKRYIYIDEMLTHNLLKLDDIDTNGLEEVRQARRKCIKQIQHCILMLEAKVDGQNMDTEPNTCTTTTVSLVGQEENNADINGAMEVENAINQNSSSTSNRIKVTKNKDSLKEPAGGKVGKKKKKSPSPTKSINRSNPAPPSTLKNQRVIIKSPALPIEYPSPDDNNAQDKDTNCKLGNKRPRKILTAAKLKDKPKLDHSEIENPGLILVPGPNDKKTRLDDDIESIDDSDEDLILPNPEPEPTLKMKTDTKTKSKLIRRKTAKKTTQATSKGTPKRDYVKKKRNYVKRNFDTGVIKHCNICSITFERPKRYQAHFRKEHTGERPFQCDQCPKNYFSEDHLRAHVKIHGTGTSGKKTGSSCTICSKYYRTKLQLEHHMNSVHLQVKLWPCDSCPQSFAIQKSLEEHIVTQHVGYRFDCPNADCDKIFNSTSGLQYHVKSIHEKAFKFTCQVENCGKSFLKKSFLRAHNERAHLKVNKFICDQCPDKKYYRKDELNLHYFATHAEESEKPHKCKYCSKAFASMTRLRNHLKLHTGVRDHICHVCGAEYAIKSSLASHISHQHPDLAENLTVDTTKRSRKFTRRKSSVPIILNTPVKDSNVIEKQLHPSSKTSD